MFSPRRSLSTENSTLRPSSDTVGKADNAAGGGDGAAQAEYGPKPTNTQTVVQTWHPHLSTFSRPFARFGLFPVGGRSTAIQLQQPPNTGSLWVLASTPLDEPTRQRIGEMGNDVKYIVAADNVHHLYVKEWSDAFPSAKCIGVEGLAEKRKDVRWAGHYGVDPPSQTYGFESEVKARYFPTFSNKDVAFFHTASRTLVVADLLFNLPANEQYLGTSKGRPTSPVPFLVSLSSYLRPHTSFHAAFLWMAGGVNGGGTAQKRRSRFAKDAEVVAGWGAARIIPCHGDVIEENGRKAWLDAFRKVSSRPH